MSTDCYECRTLDESHIRCKVPGSYRRGPPHYGIVDPATPPTWQSPKYYNGDERAADSGQDAQHEGYHSARDRAMSTICHPEDTNRHTTDGRTAFMSRGRLPPAVQLRGSRLFRADGRYCGKTTGKAVGRAIHLYDYPRSVS